MKIDRDAAEDLIMTMFMGGIVAIFALALIALFILFLRFVWWLL
jgi:hypothetical protein